MKVVQPFKNAGNATPHRLRPPDNVRWGTTHALATYMLGLLLGAVAFGLAGGGDVATVATHAAGVGGLWLGLIGGSVLCARQLGTGSVGDDFGLRARPEDIPIGVLAGLALQLIAVPLVSWPVERLTDVDVEAPARELFDAPGPRWLLVALIVVGAPIVEELFFRGFLLRSLARRLDDVIAIAVGSAMFAATHFQLAQFPGLFIVGITFAALAYGSGRLGPAIVAHITFNATAVWIVT